MGYSPISKIDESTVVNEITPTTDTSPNPRIFFIQRWTYWATLVIFGGLPIILGVVGFLAFLWIGKSDNDFWRTIVITEWMTRSVTLSSLVLRWVVAAQAAILASMLAAIMLHTRRVPLADFASISMSRFSVPGPQGLLLPFSRALRQGDATLMYISVLVLSFTTLVIQFSSTILLSDLRLAYVPDNPIKSSIRAAWGPTYPFDFEYIYSTTSYIMRSPAIYPTFAEYRSEPIFSNFVYDTGESFRGLLPIPDAETRSTLRNYTGPSSILHTRTICTRPQYVEGGERYIALERGYMDLMGQYLRVWGNFSIHEDIDSQYLNTEMETQNIWLNCTAPLPEVNDNDTEFSYSSEPEWTVSVCVGATLGNLKLPSNILSPRNMSFYVVLNTTGNQLSWWNATQDDPAYGYELWDPLSANEDNNDEWLRLQSPVGPPVSLSMSFCWYDHTALDLMIDAYGDTNRTEPLIGWNEDEAWYATDDIQRSFGIDSSASGLVQGAPNTYGQLAMQLPKFELNEFNGTIQQLPGMAGNDQILNYFIVTDLRTNRFSNTSHFMCSKCFKSVLNEDKQITEVNHILAAIFNQILRRTGRPALALQTFMTMVTMMPYYDQLPGFDGFADATYTLLVQKLAPMSWLGFWCVVALLGAHTVLVVFITAWFVRTAARDDSGFLGSSWVAISQVASHRDVGPWLSRTTALDDRSVRKMLDRSRKDTEIVLMTESAEI